MGTKKLPGRRLARVRADMLRAAGRRTVVTYGELMNRYHLSRGRTLSSVISEIDRREHERGAPGFAAIVVRKDTRFPGGGYFCDCTLPVALRRARVRSTDPRLSEAERRYLQGEQRRTWDFYRGSPPAPSRPST